MESEAIPLEVIQAINRLRREATEKHRLANDLEKHYGGKGRPLPPAGAREAERPRPNYSGQGEVAPIGQKVDPAPHDIKRRIKERGSRIDDLASHFSTTPAKILEIIQLGGSGLYVAERGWVKEKTT